MAEPFAPVDTSEGIALAADPQVDPAGQAMAPLPDPTPLVATIPRLPMPPSPPLPPSPMQDPKQKLLALAALGFALGAGRQSGMAQGAMQGLLTEQHNLHQDNLQRWQIQADEAKRQQQATLTQQNLLDRQNEAKVQQTFTNLRQDVMKAGDEESYQKTIGLYAGGLQAAGFRASPQQLMAQFPYSPPTDESEIQKAVTKYFANDLVKSLPPEQKLAGAISFKRKGQLVQMPIAQALQRLGMDIPTTDANGDPVFSSLGKGTESQQAIDRAGLEFKTQFGRAPKPGDTKDNNWIMTRAHQFTDKKDPMMEAMNQTLKELQIQGTGLRNELTKQSIGRGAAGGGGLTDEGVDYAATQYRVTGVMPALGMGNMGARNAIVNRAAEQAKTLGQSPAAAIQKQAAYKADTSALTRMRTLGSSAEAAESKALAQADLIAQLSPRVSRSSIPVINDAILSGKTRIAGDEAATQLVNAVTTFSNEYAKIMEGSTASASGSSDASRKAAARLISASMNPRQLQSVIDLMKREMQYTIQGYNVTADHIGQRMGATPQTPGATAPAGTSKFTIVPEGGP